MYNSGLVSLGDNNCTSFLWTKLAVIIHDSLFPQRNWVLGADNCYHFNAAEETCAAAAGILPSSELAGQTIEYARHLEMIV